MAESIVISIVNKLMDPLLEEVAFLSSVSDKVQSVRQKLEWIKPFLEDAENKSNESKVIQHWVGEVQEVAYRIEDAIDVYVIDIQGERERMIEIQRERERMKCSQFMACMKWVYKVPIMKPVALHNLCVELDNIETTVQKIDENRKLFNISELEGGSRARVEAERPPSYEYIDDESQIIELEAHKIILKKLLTPHPGRSVISIVGTGGLGKTTLAQKVFNSAEVKQKFNVCIWISVSESYERIQILMKILEGIRKVNQEERSQDEAYFIREIRNSLENKNFLIVLDDVWSKTLWPDHIRVACPTSEDNEGRVLITTRDRNVADNAKSEPFELQVLNPEQSQTLLYKIAFPKQNPPRGLDSLATELAKKCGYLPLALVVVGGMLYKKESCSEWTKVAKSIDWQGGESGDKCMQILAASYNNLPAVLKTCFMYLASFPEDHEIDAKSLIRKWVAEDLISDEVIGSNYLEKLVQRCLVIPSKRSYDGSLERCRLHDLLRELAIREAKEKKFFSVFINENLDQSFNDARRASLKSCTFGDSNFTGQKRVKRNYNKKLRSLMVFGKSLPDELSRFKLLKVLVMHGCGISFSKMEFEELIHLRHLELRHCRIDTDMIPESIGHLKNLLMLDCIGTWVTKLPKSLWRITTLRHVLVHNGAPHCPLPLANLPNLRTLSCVRLEHPSPTLDALGIFSNLHGLGLINSNPWVATLLKELNQLISLEIGNIFQPLPLDVLDMRDFPFYHNLQCLCLTGFWPQHVELRSHHFPPRLIKLCLFDYMLDKDPMPELEQLQNLEILEISSPSKNESMTLTCSAGGFPQLQQLHLERFPVKEFSINPGAMPMLKKLLFNSHDKMNIPELQHLKMLQEFSWLVRCFDMEIQEMREKYQHKLQHIPSVVITSKWWN